MITWTYGVYSNNYGLTDYVRWVYFVIALVTIFLSTCVFKTKKEKGKNNKIQSKIIRVFKGILVAVVLLIGNEYIDIGVDVVCGFVKYNKNCYLYEIAERIGDSYVALQENGIDKKEWEKTYNEVCEGTYITSWSEPYDTMGLIVDEYIRGEGIKDITNHLSIFENPKVYVKMTGNKVEAQLYYGKDSIKDEYIHSEYTIPSEKICLRNDI